MARVEAGGASGLVHTQQHPVKGSQRKPPADGKQPEKKAVDWKKVAEKLPWGQDEKAKADRKLLFRQFDPNGNGLLSLAEVDKGIIEIGLGDVIAKPVIMRAYQAAKALNQSGDKRQNDDYIDSGEFRLFLLYVRQYLELWVMFDAIDANKDKKIEQKEFANAVELVKKWGYTISDPAATFKEIDKDGGGVILFDEFADWAIKKKLDLEDDDDAPDAGAGSGLIAKAQTSSTGAAVAKADKGGKAPDEKKAETKKVNWKELADKLPWGTDEAAGQLRKRLFRQFDPNGNGLLSLAEVDKGVVQDLALGDVCSKAVIMRAFNAAKTVNQSGDKAANDDYVDFSEFRMLLLYIRQYVELWVMFDAMDTNKDKRIEKAEFAAALNLVKTWGFTVTDVDATFKELDADGGGKILFDEFADWAIKKKLDLPDDDDAPDAGAGSGLIKDNKPKPAAAGKKPATPAAPAPVAKAIDWADVAKKLPWGTDEESAKRRKKLFKVFDPNGNNLLSLAEVDKGVAVDLKMGDVICKAVIMRAYQAAKNVNQTESKAANPDFIDFTEFRILLLYLRQYLELWVMFDAIDTNKDKRIDGSEFAAAAKLVETWGMSIPDPAAVFAEIDVDGGGMILFDEFADWAIRKKLDLPDDDDAESAGAGAGVSRTGPDVKPKVPIGAGKKPAPATGKAPVKPSPAKTPARAVTTPATRSPPTTGAKSPAPPPPAKKPTPTPPKVEPKSPPAATTRPKSPSPKPAAAKPSLAAVKEAARATPKKEDKKEDQKVSVGIKFEPNQDNGLKIEKVTADTPAHKAGIAVGDKLQSIGGKPIATKADFVAILPTFVAGAVVDVVVRRGDSDVSLKVAF